MMTTETEIKKIRAAVKTLLENNLLATDAFTSIYWANGPIGYREGDATPYVISSDDDSEIYEEYEDIDEAITAFLMQTGHLDDAGEPWSEVQLPVV